MTNDHCFLRLPTHAIATLLLLFFALSISTPSLCSGFSSASPSQRRMKNDFAGKIVEDVVVREVVAKGIIKPAALNSRQKSFKQRDPIISLNMNLDYLAKSNQKHAAERCEEMLLRIESLHSDGYYDKAPDVVSYNSVINAYAHGRYVNSRSANAKRLMLMMEKKGVKPNTITKNILLRCILKEIGEEGPSKDKVEDAETILLTMEESALANTISYNTVMSIISKSGLTDSPQRAERWLQRLLKLYQETKNDKIQPDTTSFNSVIHAYANSRDIKGAMDRARHAEDLLRLMNQLYNSGENSNVKPDVVSYSAVINAYSKAASQNVTCATKAMDLLHQMEELYEGGDEASKPNLRTYTAAINLFARIGSPETADDLLSKMKKRYDAGDISLKPDTVCYSSVVDAYARKGGEDCALRAEELLNEMIDRYNSGEDDVMPNTQTFRSVITSLGRSRQTRAAEKAEVILNEMESLSSQGLKNLSPNTIVYNAVIDAFAKSNSVSKAYRAQLLLERMIEETEKGNIAVRPDTISYNTVINAAAKSAVGDAIVKKEAFLIGLNAFRRIHELDYCKPSSITYVSYLNLLVNLIAEGEDRNTMAKRVYGLAHSFGLANDAVKAQLRKTCTPLVVQRILSSCEEY